MTREQAEARIMEKLKEIDEIRAQYAPEDDYLSLCIRGGHLSFNNSFWLDACEHELDCWVDPEYGFFSNTHQKEADQDAADETG